MTATRFILVLLVLGTVLFALLIGPSTQLGLQLFGALPPPPVPSPTPLSTPPVEDPKAA